MKQCFMSYVPPHMYRMCNLAPNVAKDVSLHADLYSSFLRTKALAKIKQNPRLTLWIIEIITNTFLLAVDDPYKSISFDIQYLGQKKNKKVTAEKIQDWHFG